ncbi:unnamed protein product [Cylindrotheca closterium]|uniref:Fatty acid desaturase domain-containing protein n=1 Tax=Cylindrotheca closterium TaxID=2856 RepID=A0AAD2CDP3_9STRA|nr:unnamed protein product [Cylindrotheca closterium]
MMMFRSATILLAMSSSALAFNIGGKRQSPLSTPTVASPKKAVAVPMDTPNFGVPNLSKTKLDPKDDWVRNLDYDGFAKEVSALGKELRKNTGKDDVDHLNKIVNWRNMAAVFGLATIWLPVNPLTVAALSTWTYASWTMIAHHTCHGGYNRVDAGRFNSRGFALGALNRVVDWLDWMQPEAWNIEHNRLHHYRLNESKDPDLVQRNLDFIRDGKYPQFLKYVVVAFFLPIWKWFYYAPNTYKELKTNEWIRSGKELPEGYDPELAVTVVSMLDPGRKATRKIVNPLDFYKNVVGPMFFARYVAIPGALALIPGVGPTLAVRALTSLVLAELLTNVHAFVTIVTNHAGEDMYTFDDAVRPNSGSFYVRQIIGSVNYDTGDDVTDFWHGWLNYQIEHHVWPDLSMLQYQRGAPKLKAICEKYGVPYVQENVFERTRKTIDVMVGRTSMRRFPTQFEPADHKIADSSLTWKSTNGAIEDESA